MFLLCKMCMRQRRSFGVAAVLDTYDPRENSEYVPNLGEKRYTLVTGSGAFCHQCTIVASETSHLDQNGRQEALQQA